MTATTLLTLTHHAQLTSAHLGRILLSKGDTIRVPTELADKLNEMYSWPGSDEGVTVYAFSTAAAGATPKYDFTTEHYLAAAKTAGRGDSEKLRRLAEQIGTGEVTVEDPPAPDTDQKTAGSPPPADPTPPTPAPVVRRTQRAQAAAPGKTGA